MKENDAKGLEMLKHAGRISVIAKPGSQSSRITGWDEARRVVHIDVKAPAQDGKANIEIVKFLSRLSSKKASIKSGMSSRKKLILLE